MKAYYINLDRETERRDHMEQALSEVDHERVAAIDGRQRAPTGQGLTRFELACMESHRTAWKRFLATPDSFACFLEDDVHFSQDFPAYLREDAWIPADAHAVKLDSFFNRIMVGAPQPAPLGRTIAQLFTRHESCACYVLSRRGAETFLKLTENPKLPVDYIVFPEDPAGQKLRLYQLSPAAAIQDSRYLQHYAQGKNFQSAISRLDRGKPERLLPRLAFVLKRESWRLVLNNGRAWRYFVNRVWRRLKPEVIPFQ